MGAWLQATRALVHTLTKQGGLALLLAVLVISLCLSQRMGLKVACAVDHQAQYLAQTSTPALGINSSVDLGKKDSVTEPDHDSCSLSEQLLSKVFQNLDPLFIAIILLFALWLAPLTVLRFSRRTITPLLFSGRRRHLVLCVFRE
ncbi:hypothetical protein [Oceanisphaera sp. IT1-181]|uniref:hypothetical protein n=1 Tax=Oceanisphaera sp. IT1-181 TaxID=3081199 RepID=UPI0029C9E117|nr:hypothetical protein [Oceanisphaera sp. IT1-181]